MSLSDTQIFVALAVALIPGFLALRLSTELYK
ncbi:photosystem I reaction center subunit XII [Romeria aff. gracilis LEGE 07310]|uniref:Photosystem I reaction center subunit XII n=1 Tax=Vasconcelosia minhoensis LEGE 07310 TaxID=915328 RepID=A0A8J7A7N1_9CYAN|nr:photosystem I reaction center subunit XII [Romeria gracilis]MBE9078482.1 photosystem I reaction center subunit XII [Romeria aff. gracilis LEGE 07310]